VLPLFAYGILMDADVLAHVLGPAGRRFATAPATLRGYHRVYAPGGTYPMLRPAPDGSVDGLLLRGVSRPQLARLTAFEGDGYTLERRPVASGGETIDAQVYLPRIAPRGGRLWDFEDWRRRHKRRLMKRLR